MTYPPTPPDVAIRLNYHDGMFLTAQNMTVEQNYFTNWIKYQNRYLYTPGVLSGLNVTLQGNMLVVAGGAGFDGDGNFLNFPGTVNNAIGPGTGFGNPYTLYLSYPPTISTTSDFVDEAAILQNGMTSFPPLNSIPLATVYLDQENTGVIEKFTDARVGVTSRLPVVIPGETTVLMSQPPDLNGALAGVVTADTRTLLKPGDSVTLTVPYRSGGAQAFSVPPAVNATVHGSVPYAVNVAGVGTGQFTLTLTAVQTRTADTPPSVQTNWLALPPSLTF
ncbi:hypothetical protein WJ74_09515 [Burkholderia ubonensis]|uniref:hypothetical protein n=1 Tax=Burkholderia ubonensis TaxID=101571 RepID=UPI00076DE1DD|nr:hypothetical protein [Burkholderia ubonensis]KVO16998.1 hypothetical protein WJ74_09515 [Burkholderia ubonensis]